jgi:hypothetical protein
MIVCQVCNRTILASKEESYLLFRNTLPRTLTDLLYEYQAISITPCYIPNCNSNICDLCSTSSCASCSKLFCTLHLNQCPGCLHTVCTSRQCQVNCHTCGIPLCNSDNCARCCGSIACFNIVCRGCMRYCRRHRVRYCPDHAEQHSLCSI